MTAHAYEETVEDNFGLHDVESAISNGVLTRIHKDDPRGTRYTITGYASDGLTPVGVVGRFVSNHRYLIITVYEITEKE